MNNDMYNKYGTLIKNGKCYIINRKTGYPLCFQEYEFDYDFAVKLVKVLNNYYNFMLDSIELSYKNKKKEWSEQKLLKYRIFELEEELKHICEKQ